MTITEDIVVVLIIGALTISGVAGFILSRHKKHQRKCQHQKILVTGLARPEGWLGDYENRACAMCLQCGVTDLMYPIGFGSFPDGRKVRQIMEAKGWKLVDSNTFQWANV